MRIVNACMIYLQVMSELLRKEDPREMGYRDEEYGFVVLTPEELMGPRVPIPQVCACILHAYAHVFSLRTPMYMKVCMFP
jgi:hypothetical protein